MKPSQILKRAQKLIDAPEKWCKGRMHSGDYSAHCAVGAIFAVPGQGAVFGVSRTYLDQSMTLKDEPRVMYLNDAPDTEHIHVMMAYDLAILMAQDDERGKR